MRSPSVECSVVTTYALCTAVRITLWSTDPQNVDSAAVAAEEAAIVEAVSVDPSEKTLRGAYGEFHAFLVASLGNCKDQLVARSVEISDNLPSMHSPSLRPMLRS